MRPYISLGRQAQVCIKEQSNNRGAAATSNSDHWAELGGDNHNNSPKATPNNPKVSSLKPIAFMMSLLQNKVVLITGAGSGIGKALAQAFHQVGCKLVLVDFNEASLQAVQAELGGGPNIAILQADVSDTPRAKEIVDSTIQQFGGVDILINNAGISQRSLLSSTQVEVISKVMAVNFQGAVNFTVPALASIRQRKGQIVAMSSVAGFAPLIGRTAYAASKHALHGFFDSLRTEVQHDGVNILLVCPSFVQTAIEANALSGDGKPLGGAKRAVANLSQPEEIAQAILTALRQRKKRLFPDPISRSAWVLSRIAPNFYAKIMMKKQGAEFL